ncbi:MAG: PAS domain S-box protein [Methanomicrobiales archaeon]|nr:PAS domain S-box protein [Methanomicrobiales archaeon]
MKRHLDLDESDLVRLWVILAFIIIALCATVYSFDISAGNPNPYFVYLFPQLYYIPIVLVSIWYPRFGLQATILLVAALLTISAYFSLIGTAVDPITFTLNAALYIWVVAATTLLARDGDLFSSRYRRLYDNAAAGIVLFDIQKGSILEANRTLAERLGYTLRELKALPVAALWAEPAQRESLFERLRAGFPVVNREARFASKSGDLLDFLISCREIEFEKVFEATFIDISALKGLESAIGNSRKHFEKIVGHSRDLNFLQELDGTYRQVHWKAADAYGIGIQGLIGRSPYDFLTKEEADRYMERVEEVRRSRRSVEWEMPITLNGREHTFSTTLTPLFDDAGAVVGIMGSCRDVTEETGENLARIQLEREIRHRRDFITTAAHELRTPLQPILGYLHLLLDEPDLYSLNEETTRILRLCLENVERERRIVDRMLELSILYNGRLQLDRGEIRLFDLVSSIIARGGYDKDAAVTVRIPRDTVIVADPNCIYQAIETLVSNAVRYNTPPKAVSITYSSDGRDHCIAVEDNGIGIDKKSLGAIFKPFYLPDADNLSRQTNRMGLGLSIAREYIRLHGGDIHVRSRINQGSTFTIRIPKEAER